MHFQLVRVWSKHFEAEATSVLSWDKVSLQACKIAGLHCVKSRFVFPGTLVFRRNFLFPWGTCALAANTKYSDDCVVASSFYSLLHFLQLHLCALILHRLTPTSSATTNTSTTTPTPATTALQSSNGFHQLVFFFFFFLVVLQLCWCFSVIEWYIPEGLQRQHGNQ